MNVRFTSLGLSIALRKRTNGRGIDINGSIEYVVRRRTGVSEREYYLDEAGFYKLVVQIRQKHSTIELGVSVTVYHVPNYKYIIIGILEKRDQKHHIRT